jgi:hypothetical protein
VEVDTRDYGIYNFDLAIDWGAGSILFYKTFIQRDLLLF